MKPLSLGIVSDEISLDLREALDHGLAWGISIYELRSLRTGRIPVIESSEWDDVRSAVGQKKVEISALSPGIFKNPLSKQKELEGELNDVLPKTIAMAKEVDASLIVVFGFQRESEEPPSNKSKVIDLMRKAATVAAQEKMTIVIENEPGFWCDTGANTAAIIRAVNSPALRANWDPCNAYGTEEVPYPDGYNALKPYIANVHVKDTKQSSLVQCVPVGEGMINWRGQLEALMREKIVNHITIETHCLPLVEKSAQNVATLKKMMDEIMEATKETL